MKSIKSLFAVSAISVMSFGALAQSISATASTQDAAETKISAMAKQQGSHYTITSARADGHVHIGQIRMVSKESPERQSEIAIIFRQSTDK